MISVFTALSQSGNPYIEAAFETLLSQTHTDWQQLIDPVHVMNEAYRVLAPGGFFLIRVPSTDGRGAFQNPLNITFWNEHSFWYYARSRDAVQVPSFQRSLSGGPAAHVFPR